MPGKSSWEDVSSTWTLVPLELPAPLRVGALATFAASPAGPLVCVPSRVAWDTFSFCPHHRQRLSMEGSGQAGWPSDTQACLSPVVTRGCRQSCPAWPGPGVSRTRPLPRGERARTPQGRSYSPLCRGGWHGCRGGLSGDQEGPARPSYSP